MEATLKKKKNDEFFFPRIRCRRRLLRQSITHWRGGILGLRDCSNHCCLRGDVSVKFRLTEEEGRQDRSLGSAFQSESISTTVDLYLQQQSLLKITAFNICYIRRVSKLKWHTAMSIIIRKRLKATKIEWRRSVHCWRSQEATKCIAHLEGSTWRALSMLWVIPSYLCCIDRLFYSIIGRNGPIEDGGASHFVGHITYFFFAFTNCKGTNEDIIPWITTLAIS